MNYTQQCACGAWYDSPAKSNLCPKCEWIEERAAILEFDGGLTREEAEKRARELWADMPA